MPTPEHLEERSRLIAEECRLPKTIYDVMERFHIGYSTAQRELAELVDRGVLKETPFRDGKKKRWVLNSTAGANDPIARVLTPSGAYTVMEYMQFDDPVADSHLTEELQGVQELLGRMTPLRNVAGALAQVWRFTRYARAEGIGKAQAGTMTPIECKRAVREALEWARRLESVLEQILLAPIWEEELGGPSIQERLGGLDHVDAAKAMALAQNFEKRMGR